MLILASQSPRRAELLTQVGVPFTAVPATIDERVAPGEQVGDYVRRMAIAKAQAARRRHPDLPVLGADTAVVLDRRILGKPNGEADAVETLLTLSGRTHEVLTGVALVTDSTRYELSISRVAFRVISEAEAAAYWATGEPADKAGGYAIQGLGAVFVERIEGSYSGVVGLPLFETLALLRTIGVHSRIGV